MPITIADAPDTLPKGAKRIYVGAFNGAYSGECKDEGGRRDECAARIAWKAVKGKYKQVGDKWVAKAAHVQVEFYIAKASLQADGTMRWLCVASDTNPDTRRDRTTLTLFRDWMQRVESDIQVPFLPPPRHPFLGLSHYPSLEGFGEAGLTDRMYIDGDQFKAGGAFLNNALGLALFDAIRNELAAIKRGEHPELPIRISAAWWDIEHAHGDFLFRRSSLDDICPMCVEDTSKTFLKGQLDHFAATRVPINPRTSVVALEEKSMAKVTRHDDAASIVDSELADELEEKTKRLLEQRSDADDETPGAALVIKAEDEPVETGQETEEPAGGGMEADAALEEQAVTKTVDGKKFPAGDFLVVEDPKKPSTWHLQVKKNGKPDHRLMGAAWAALHQGYRGNKYDGPDKQKAIGKLKGLYKSEKLKLPTAKSLAEMFGDDVVIEQQGADVPVTAEWRPFGGATSINAAEAWLAAQEKMFQVYDSWGMFRAVMENILDDTELTDKLPAVRQAISEFGDRVEAIKSGAVDAFLAQSVAVQETQGEEIMPEQIDQVQETQEEQVTEQAAPAALDPGTAFWGAIEQLTGNISLSRAEMLQQAQDGLKALAAAVQNQIDSVRPPAADGEEMRSMVAKAVAEAVQPLNEQLALLLAKQQAAAQPATPVQKSLIAPARTPQAVPEATADTGLGIPPSSLRAIARRSVGLQS